MAHEGDAKGTYIPVKEARSNSLALGVWLLGRKPTAHPSTSMELPQALSPLTLPVTHWAFMRSTMPREEYPPAAKWSRYRPMRMESSQSPTVRSPFPLPPARRSKQLLAKAGGGHLGAKSSGSSLSGL